MENRRGMRSAGVNTPREFSGNLKRCSIRRSASFLSLCKMVGGMAAMAADGDRKIKCADDGGRVCIRYAEATYCRILLLRYFDSSVDFLRIDSFSKLLLYQSIYE